MGSEGIRYVNGLSQNRPRSIERDAASPSIARADLDTGDQAVAPVGQLVATLLGFANLRSQITSPHALGGPLLP